MARTFAEETVETSNTTGTGTYTLEGAKGDYLPFGTTYSTGDEPAYVVRNANNTKWEMNRGGVYTESSPATLARNVWKSTNGNAAVSWTVDDLPLTVYVPASAEVHEGVVTGWLASARHALLRAGSTWWDSTAGVAVSWIHNLAIGTSTDTRLGLYDAVQGLYFPDDRRRSVAVGAANRTVLATDINTAFGYNTTAAARTVTLPAGSTVKDGFTTHHVGLDVANGLVLTPDAGDGIDGGADGATLSVPGKVPVSVRWDAAGDTWRTSYVPAQAPNWAGRRQTVAGGPVDTAGLPTFLPASSVSLNLTTANVTTTAVLVVSAANGWLAANGRANDLVGAASANFTWSGLTASRVAASPNYLYVTISAAGVLTAGSTIVAPVYQWGGTPATTAGLFTFNISEMKGYLGNGSTAPQTNLVMVGEAATDGSTVTSTVAYAYNGRYESAFTATLPAAGTLVTASHNIGVYPRLKELVAECTTIDIAYAVGQQISSATGLMSGDSLAMGVTMPTTRNAVSAGVINGGNWYALYGDLTNRGAITRTSWKYKFLADRGWG